MKKPLMPGQVLGEYGLAIALIALTGIGAFLFLGSTARDSIFGMTSGMSYEQANTQPPTQTEQINQGTIGQETALVSNLPGTAANNGDATLNVTFRLDNGQTITLPNYPNNLQQAVETNGTNGATELLANQLSLITSQLSQTDSLDPEQVNKLANLANQGHRIANIQGAISEGIDHNIQSTSPKPLAHLHFDYDQKSVYQGEMANLIGDHILDGKMNEGVEIQKMKQLLDNAQTSGALADPNLNNVVSALVADIALLGNQTKASMDEANQKKQIPDNFKALVAAKLTNKKSGQICQSGGGMDVGISCAKNRQ